MENGEKPSITHIKPEATQEELDRPNGYQIKKQQYLDLRRNGFDERDASLVTGFTAADIRRERRDDSSFAGAEAALASVPERHSYLMKVKYVTAIGHALKEQQLAIAALDPDLDGFDTFTEREFKYHMDTRKSLPGGQQETESAPTTGIGSLNIYLNEQELQSSEARRAGARSLLEQFDASDKYRNPDQQLIEGAVLEAD